MDGEAIIFFKKYQRFEFALLMVSRYRGTRNRDGLRIAEARPNQFVDRNRAAIEALFSKFGQSEEGSYFVTNPPAALVESAEGVNWQPHVSLRGMIEVCEMVERVRNNLFHGNKLLPGPNDDVRILRGATLALDMLAEVDPDVLSGLQV